MTCSIAHLLERNIDSCVAASGSAWRWRARWCASRRMFLLDEPLSALDLKLRESLRAELRQLQQQESATILYATHDYHGAIAIADRIAMIVGRP